jgi:shikimate kinase
MEQLIFLTGFMGVGKTTTGKRLANSLSIDFIDTDEMIEKKYSCSIVEYFENYGESSFRKEERAILLDIIKSNNQAVISVGGGLPCYNDNMEFMNQNGTTVYLQRPSKELFHRLLQGRHKRPLIARMSDDELLNFIESKLQEREKFYLLAEIIADRDQQEPSELIELIEAKS